MADKPRLETLVLASALLGIGAQLLLHWLGSVELALIVSTLIFAITCFAHAYYSLGWKRAATLFTLALGFSWLMETISIETCMIGCYEYTAVLGPKLGVVPLMIPLGWFTTTYTAYAIVNLVVDGTTWSGTGLAVRSILVALVGAFIQSAWDLAGDPYMVHVVGAWVWFDGGPFFGIPWGNYIGWVEIGFMAALMFRWLERDIPREPIGPMTPLLAMVPVAVYVVSGLPLVFVGEPTATRLLPIFAMGTASVLAIVRARRVASLDAAAQTGPEPAAEPEPSAAERGQPIDRAIETAVLVVFAACFVGWLLIQLWHLLAALPGPARVPWQIVAPILALMAFAHATLELGPRRALGYLLAAVIISLVFESIGVVTGVPFGRYVYTNVLGLKLFGLVPWVIPLTYFAILYPSWLVACTALGVDPRSFDPRRLGWASVVVTALVSALAMTAWDLTMDPVMVHEVHAWVWLDGGAWFGVPFSNFAGWVLVNGVIVLAWALLGLTIPEAGVETRRRWPTALAIVAYSLLWVADLALGFPVQTKLVAPFVMGIPAALALLRLYTPARVEQAA